MKLIPNGVGRKYIPRNSSSSISMITSRLPNGSICSMTSISHFIEQGFVHAHHLLGGNVQKICDSMQTKVIVSSMTNSLIFLVTSLYFLYESGDCRLMHEYAPFFSQKPHHFFLISSRLFFEVFLQRIPRCNGYFPGYAHRPKGGSERRVIEEHVVPNLIHRGECAMDLSSDVCRIPFQQDVTNKTRANRRR